MSILPKLIAFYLPQFHPIPENDAWWGKGFTEWTNVARAQPLFPGHYQPHLPADLGFYDLRLPEARRAQAELARENGIHGFCYYHFWFDGRRVLERPFDEVLASGAPDFPFCLCWANENWTRTWDGLDEQVLLAQNYSDADDIAHIRWLSRAFVDNRYIRIEGKPLFLVYRATSLPDPRRTTALWREEAARLGIGELFLARVESNFLGERGDPRALGFDAAVEFQPDALTLFGQRKDRVPDARVNIEGKWQLRGGDLWFSYREMMDAMLARAPVSYPRFAGVSPGWDNTPRRGAGAGGITECTPADFERWLRIVAEESRGRMRSGGPTGQAIFINAWNEWGESCHLEPCQRWGHGYLEAAARALAADGA
ncbi:MAG: glycoside hydrolase family 99-like domain-containing protein [Chthoniobacterales bacterium]|nr:glycoside hydrolase family 99-like domain-containing protein [Chthoniobacterales bacterium]